MAPFNNIEGYCPKCSSLIGHPNRPCTMITALPPLNINVGPQWVPPKPYDLSRPLTPPAPPSTSSATVEDRSTNQGAPSAQLDTEVKHEAGSASNLSSYGMAENVAPPSANGAGAGASATATATNPGAAGIPFYEKQRQHLKELLAKKRALDKKMAAQEESIYQKETDYLENTPAGNIITGFDNYTKGTTGAAAQRRKTGLTDANRVFSRSSISYNPNAQQDTPTPTTHSTPASHAPTPVSASFANKEKDRLSSAGPSGAPTPTSATGSRAGKKAGKKSKAPTAQAAAAAGVGDEDSGTDSRETKRMKTSFGAARKGEK